MLWIIHLSGECQSGLLQSLKSWRFRAKIGTYRKKIRTLVAELRHLETNVDVMVVRKKSPHYWPGTKWTARTTDHEMYEKL